MKIVAILVLLATVVITIYGGVQSVRQFRASLAVRIARTRGE